MASICASRPRHSRSQNQIRVSLASATESSSRFSCGSMAIGIVPAGSESAYASLTR